MAIFLYARLNQIYEKYEPIITTTVKETIRNLVTHGEFSPGTNSSIVLNPIPGRESPYALKVANEVIRLVNRRLREMAVISRIQIDEDQYEFKRMVQKPELKAIAEEVMAEVFDLGSGKFLSNSDKAIVRNLVKQSVG